MSDSSTTIAGGSPGTHPDSNVALDLIAGKAFQQVKLKDPTVDSTTGIGIDANPMKVKNRRAGTSDYDSGIVAVNNGAPTAVATVTIYPEQGYISNTGSAAAVVTLTNTAGTTLLVETIAPQSRVPFPCGGALVGLKAGADKATVILHVFGGQ